MYENIKEQIVNTCHKMWTKGWVASNDGNVSVKVKEGLYLVTQTGMSKADVTVDNIGLIDHKGNVLDAKPDFKPSSEIKMHLKCYEMREDIKAVLHAHPPVSTGFACAKIPLDDYCVIETVLSLGSVPITPYATPSTYEVCEAIEPFLQSHDALLLENHGALTVGADLQTAYNRMETLEHQAKISIVARLLGGAKDISEENVKKLVDLRKSYNLTGRHPGFKKYSK